MLAMQNICIEKQQRRMRKRLRFVELRLTTCTSGDLIVKPASAIRFSSTTLQFRQLKVDVNHRSRFLSFIFSLQQAVEKHRPRRELSGTI